MKIARSLRYTFRILKGNIAVFTTSLTLGSFARQMAYPYNSLYVLALGGSATVIGFINSLSPLLGLVIFPLGGYFADRAGRVKLIVLSNAFAVGITLMRFVAPSWEVLAVAALLQGLVVLGFPSRSALVADSLSPQDRGRGIATMNTITGSLAIFAPYLAGIIVDAYGPNTGVRMLYGVMLVLYAVSTLIYHRFLKDSVPQTPNRFQPAILPRVLKDTYADTLALMPRLPRSLKAQTAVIVLAFMANGVAGSFWVVYAVEEIGLSPSEWGLILLVDTVLRMCLFLPVSVLVDRWGRATSLRVALFMALFSIPSFVFATSFGQVLLVRAAIAAAYVIAIPASVALMADTVPREIRGRVMAAIGSGGLLIGTARGGTGGSGIGYVVTIPLMLASLAGGILYALDPRCPWLFAAVAMAISVVLAALFVRDPQHAEV